MKVAVPKMVNALEEIAGSDGGLYCFFETDHGVTQIGLSVRAVSSSKGEFTVWGEDEAFEAISSLASGSGKLSLLLEGAGVFFRSQFVSMGENRLMRLRLPTEEGRFFERRAEERGELAGPMEARFAFRGKRFRKLCFDIHEHGMSLILGKEEAMGLRAGSKIPQMSVVLGKCEESVVAEIVTAVKLAPRAKDGTYHTGVRVSFKFIAPGERFRRLIALVRAQAFAQRP